MNRLIVAIALAAGIATPPAGAMSAIPDDPDDPDAPTGWHGEITPYLWATGLTGEMNIRGHHVNLDKSSTELFEALETGGSLQAVLQHDSLVMFAQFDYLDFSTDAMAVDAQPRNGSLDSTTQLSQVGMGYQVGNENGKVDILVGLRHLRLENALTVKTPARETREAIDVNDLVAIIRPSFRLGDTTGGKWAFDMPVVLGAGDSDLAWELFPHFRYALAEHWAGRFGYRAIGSIIRHDEADEVQIGMQGWMLGFGYSW